MLWDLEWRWALEWPWVVAFGGCTISGGPYANYSVLKGVHKIIPVDLYIPGCPPRPEALLDGIIKLREDVVMNDKPLRRHLRHI